MLGFLLARSGVEVVVLEKHGNFLRDFRGDTIHPSTLELMHELGILDEFLKRPHNEVRQLVAQIGDTEITFVDFTQLPTQCKFLVLMPQWDFLNFLVEQAKHFAAFHLRMEAEAGDLIREHGRVVGVRAKTPRGELEVRADLTVGADGRSSMVREKAGLEVIDFGAPMDVLWMRISRRTGDPGQTLGRVNSGAMLILLERGDYWQCGLVIRKGAFDEIKQKGLADFQQRLAALAPFFRDRVAELDDWNKIKLLTVKVDRLRRWHDAGILCLGDAAHAMSPIGGVGINLAIQDAVAAANILAEPLWKRTVGENRLHQVQRRRELPTRLTQRLQLFIQNQVIRRVLSSERPISAPMRLKLFQRWPFLRRIPGRLIGMGFRPEHVKIRERDSSDHTARTRPAFG
ncbi:MAG: monooxygenase FAD-binding [Pedosphaera sp.]|nr:monooxygenase FAD-binding [Pedosphaera sp.]